METNSFFELLRSFNQLSSLQLERAQEHLRHHIQKHGGQGHGRVPLVPALIALDRYEHEADAVLLDKSYQQIAPALQSQHSFCLLFIWQTSQKRISHAKSSSRLVNSFLTDSSLYPWQHTLERYPSFPVFPCTSHGGDRRVFVIPI